MISQTPVTKDIVLVGAGHAHVGVLRNFGTSPMPGVRLTLITREVDTPYSGMLPGLIAGHYDYDAAHIDAGPLTRFANARLYQTEAIGLDLDRKRVICRDRPHVPYDVLTIDIGSTPGAQGIPGVAEHAIPVKPIDGFLARFEAARQRILAAKGLVHIGVVGAGAGGIELMLALQCRLKRDVAEAGFDASPIRFTIFEESEEILPGFPKRMRRRIAQLMSERGISVMTGARVRAIEPAAVHIERNGRIPVDVVFWTTGAEPAPWLARTGLALDEKGFIRVAQTLQSISHPDVFAAGDVAVVEGFQLPRSGVYAVRAGPQLARNLRRIASGKPPARYRPQREAMYLLSTGERYAFGTRNGLTFAGAWVWRFKDWIDRRFMAKFNVLPNMEESGRSAGAVMRCGDCGAKVGAKMLSRVLSRIEPARREDVVIGLDLPDDAAIVDTGGAELSVQTVDHFRAFIDDPYIFGKIAANNALGGIYAMGAEPSTALAIVTMPFGSEGKVEADLAMSMAGANEVLREAGCALVGGHTSEGPGPALGFSVAGRVSRGRIIRKSGLRPGDALILTKPLGTGILFAAHMRGKAKARWIMAALAQMTKSNRDAAAVLRDHHVDAMTDVSGFGLLGHLLEMVRASEVDATIGLHSLPLLDGVGEVVSQQIFSSFQPENERLGGSIRNVADVPDDPLYPVLFDPQTAGGLLAAVPAADSAACVDALHSVGYADAAVVGRVHHRSPDRKPIEIELGSLDS